MHIPAGPFFLMSPPSLSFFTSNMGARIDLLYKALQKDERRLSLWNPQLSPWHIVTIHVLAIINLVPLVRKQAL